MVFDKVRYAENIIAADYGVVARVEGKKKYLIKFGSNFDLNNTIDELVWDYGGVEVLATGNDIDTISSSNSGDTLDVIVEGHTVDANGDLTFVVQTITLTGQAKKLLSTPLYRATRLYNASSTNLAGDVYVYEDDTLVGGVPQTPAKVHLMATQENNQSQKCATSLSSKDFWIVTELVVSVGKQTSASVDFKLQISVSGGVFRTVYPISSHSTAGSITITSDIPFIVPPNSDVRVLAQSSANSTVCTAALHGYLALVQ